MPQDIGVEAMRPFVLKQHERDFSKMRELRIEEITSVAGGTYCARGTAATSTVDTGDQGGGTGFDGCDPIK